MKQTISKLSFLSAGLISAVVGASQSSAQEIEATDEVALEDRTALLDYPGSPISELAEHGIILEGRWTQFYQGIIAGDGYEHWETGGKGDLIATFDGARLGLWDGFYINIHYEFVRGYDVNNQGDGSLIPLNTAMAFPRLGGYDEDLSLVVTQEFGDAFSLSVGKFNLLDSAAKTPLMGGGGEDTFWNTAFAAPISGVTPPYLIGAIATLKTDPAIYTLMVYDPRNAQDWDVIEHPFAEGVTTSLSATVPTRFGGLPGFYSVRGVYSTAEGFDLDSIPQLIGLPPDSQEILTRQGYWFVSASMQQYLYVDPSNPEVGWGVFAQIGLSDGNPNPVQGSVIAGIGGNNLLPGRELDRWGLGYFKYFFSDDLIAGLDEVGFGLQDEQGVELFYNWAVTPAFRLTADLQWIDPGLTANTESWIAGFSAQVRF